MMKVFYPDKVLEYFQFLEKLDCTVFDFWPEEFCRGRDDLALRRAYDVIVSLNQVSSVYYDETYSVSIKESILFNVPPSQNLYHLKGCRFVPSDYR